MIIKKYTWDYIQKYPEQTKRLLGIDREQLEKLIELGKFIHNRNKEETEKNKIRINQKEAGCPCKLSELEQIILMLIYLRHHLSFQLLGLLFQVSESMAHNIFTYWQKLFEKILPESLLEQIKNGQFSEDLIQKKLLEYELIVDSAEQVIERPLDYQEQKKYYSGKKKTHTFKSQFIVLPKGEETQPISCGIDPGKHYGSLGLQSSKVTLFTSHIFLPFETVKKRMEQGAMMRRNRRGRRINRKLPYELRAHRQCRFSNRKQSKLPPSIQANCQLLLRVTTELSKLYPISSIVYEYCKADVDLTSGRKKAKSGKGFSPVMVGQAWILEQLFKIAPVIKKLEVCQPNFLITGVRKAETSPLEI